MTRRGAALCGARGTPAGQRPVQPARCRFNEEFAADVDRRVVRLVTSQPAQLAGRLRRQLKIDVVIGNAKPLQGASHELGSRRPARRGDDTTRAVRSIVRRVIFGIAS